MADIVKLERSVYAGYELEFVYGTDWFYDVQIDADSMGFAVRFEKKRFEKTIQKRFTDKLYAPHWDAPEAYGIFDGDVLIAALEVTPEVWNNRLRVTNLWVDAPYRRLGYGRLLMDKAKEMAAHGNHRAAVLETQCCNAGAIAFYFCQGFVLAGFDRMAYSNEDIEKREVRLEMAYWSGRERI